MATSKAGSSDKWTCRWYWQSSPPSAPFVSHFQCLQASWIFLSSLWLHERLIINLKGKKVWKTSLILSMQRNAEMVPTPQWIYLSSCFGLNWSWWRTPSPRPHADTTVTLNPSQVIFATSTHRVVTLSLFLHWHLWQQSPPTPQRHWMWFTMRHLRTLHGGGGRGFRPKTSTLTNPLSHCELCVCASSWRNYDLSHTLMTFLPFFSSPCMHLFLSCSIDDLPIGWPRTSERTTELHEEHLQSTTLKKNDSPLKNKRDNPLRHLNTPAAPFSKASHYPPSLVIFYLQLFATK